jgi:hypothetical protein
MAPAKRQATPQKTTPKKQKVFSPVGTETRLPQNPPRIPDPNLRPSNNTATGAASRKPIQALTEELIAVADGHELAASAAAAAELPNTTDAIVPATAAPTLTPTPTPAVLTAPTFETPFESWAVSKIFKPLQGQLHGLAALGPTSRAGLPAYDPDSFVRVLGTDKKYECCLTVDYFEVWTFPLGPDCAPTIGAVERIYKSVFLDPVTGHPHTSFSSEDVLVRVSSTNEVPIRGKVPTETVWSSVLCMSGEPVAQTCESQLHTPLRCTGSAHEQLRLLLCVFVRLGPCCRSKSRARRGV